VGKQTEIMTSFPLPWSVESDGFELRILDVNGKSVIYGNVNGGLEYDDPSIPEMLSKALELLSAHLHPAREPQGSAPANANQRVNPPDVAG